VSAASKTTPRTRYHHGDLRNALTEEAVELARAGGPDAVVLREVARRVGVSATAAYRHFATHDDLLDQVKQAALRALADSIVAALDAVPAGGDPAVVSVERFRAACEGYLHFARSQAGLFNTAFCHTGLEDTGPGPIPFGEADAFRILGELLDDLVAVGRMDPASRPGADIASWSAVHGYASLLVGGPLEHHLSDEEQAFVWGRTLDMIITGLTVPAAG